MPVDYSSEYLTTVLLPEINTMSPHSSIHYLKALLNREKDAEPTLESELKMDSKEELLRNRIELLEKELGSKKEKENSDKSKREELFKRMDDISHSMSGTCVM